MGKKKIIFEQEDSVSSDIDVSSFDDSNEEPVPKPISKKSNTNGKANFSKFSKKNLKSSANSDSEISLSDNISSINTDSDNTVSKKNKKKQSIEESLPVTKKSTKERSKKEKQVVDEDNDEESVPVPKKSMKGKQIIEPRNAKSHSVGRTSIEIEQEDESLPVTKKSAKEKSKKEKQIIEEYDDESLSVTKKSTSKKDKLPSYTSLVSHEHDYPDTKFKKSDHIRKQKRIVEIKKIPQAEQKSVEWLEQRKECLTATAIAIAIDEDSHNSPAKLLLDKCGRCPAFTENPAVHHGKKYEEIASMYYGFRNNIKVAEYGMILHSEHRFIGASPDGICEKEAKDGVNLSTLVGRLLEIKCPYSRKIKMTGRLDGDICPHDYYVQVQTQLFVTELDECDFLQCEIGEYESYEQFIEDSDPHIPTLSKETGLEKGCIIQLLPRKFVYEPPVYDPTEERIESTEKEITDEYISHLLRAQYIYPEELHMSIEETEKWIATQVLNYHTHKFFKTHIIDRIIYFKFNKVSCHLIKKDPEWFSEQIPILDQFWNYVVFYRLYPKKLNDLVKYVKDVGINNTAIIFEKINKDYLRVNKTSKYKPLYQEKNPWRIENDKKEAFFEKRNAFLAKQNKK